MAAFFDMGGFAAFVWPCYALSLGGMIWLGLGSWRRARETTRRLAEMTDEASEPTALKYLKLTSAPPPSYAPQIPKRLGLWPRCVPWGLPPVKTSASWVMTVLILANIPIHR